MSVDPPGNGSQSNARTLHHILKNSKELSASAVIDILNNDPQSINATDSHGDRPITTAIKYKQSVDIVRVLAERCPASLRPADSDTLPIFTACYCFYQSTDIVEYLVDAYPDSLCIANSYGQLPIHVLASMFLYSDRAQLSRLLRLFVRLKPETVHVADKFTDTPLELILRRAGEHSVMYRIFLNAHPPGISHLKHRVDYGRMNADARAAALSLLLMLRTV